MMMMMMMMMMMIIIIIIPWSRVVLEKLIFNHINSASQGYSHFTQQVKKFPAFY
jgi:hypothetical protein